MKRKYKKHTRFTESDYRNVYESAEKATIRVRGWAVSCIPDELRASEEQIDKLLRTWRTFRLRIPKVAREAGIRQNRLYTILYKKTFATIEEADKIEAAMLYLIRHDKYYNCNEYPQRK